jgi:hypothetical protein
MKQYLAVYIGTGAKMAQWGKMEEQQRKAREAEGLKAWHNWVAEHSSAIVAMGGPLGKTKQIAPGGVTDIKNNLTGFTVVQAESHDAAAKLFENHPHFAIFPGDSVEVMECLPVPGM